MRTAKAETLALQAKINQLLVTEAANPLIGIAALALEAEAACTALAEANNGMLNKTLNDYADTCQYLVTELLDLHERLAKIGV